VSGERQILPWTNVVGVARSTLATGTLLTLCFHDPDQLFRPLGQSMGAVTRAVGVTRFNLFNLISDLDIARWIAIVILALVVIGWRPRLTGLLHWWVAASFNSGAIVVDGGDQVCAVLTLLLVPDCLTDGRRWHWSRPALPPPAAMGPEILRLVALSACFVIRAQVAFIYFQAGVAKTTVGEWSNGTALYYWFVHPTFGVTDPIARVLLPPISHAAVVTGLTWAVMAFEILLFTALVMRKRWWAPLLVAGLGFHLSIIVFHGLVSFFLAMAGGLVLYLRPVERSFQAPAIGVMVERGRRVAQRLRGLEPTADAARGRAGTGAPVLEG
jgi:antimicrobial peptide system SdpB family protein